MYEFNLFQWFQKVDVYLSLEDLVDKEKEKNRLCKQIDKLKKDISKLQGRINSPGFKEKAPAAVYNEVTNSLIDKEAQVAAVELEILRLDEQSGFFISQQSGFNSQNSLESSIEVYSNLNV